MSSFLSDADVWMCVCYTRLVALAAQRTDRALDEAACDTLARTLQRDLAYQHLDPGLAAETHLQAITARAA